MQLGLDYAGSSPGAAAVKAAGFSFVARYLSRYTSKTIKVSEFNDMTNNSVGVVLVFEDYANQALSGYNQGVLDAQFALAQANSIGWPSDRPIHFAVDFDISDAQKPIAGQYMKGVASVIGLARTGAYGGYWWIKYCAENNLAAPNARWQAVAWSGGMIHASATMFQQLAGTTVNGTSCDINRQLKDDFGQSGAEMANPVKGDVDNILGELWGRAPNPEDYGYEAQNWHDFIYGAMAAYPWRDRFDILQNQFPQAIKDRDNANGIAEIRSGNFQVICDAVGITRQPDEQATTKAITDKFAAAVQGKTESDAALKLSQGQVTKLEKEIADLKNGSNIVITKSGWTGLFDVVKQFFAKRS